MIINKEELKEIRGGGFRWVLAGVAAIGVFISGIVDGFLRPNSCK